MLEKAILDYVQSASMISASNLSRYLVNECGASSETFSTGRFKIYPDVCKFLDYLAEQGLYEKMGSMIGFMISYNNSWFKILEKSS